MSPMQGGMAEDVPFDPQQCLKCHCEMQPYVSSALQRHTLNFLLEAKVIADIPRGTVYFSFYLVFIS